MHIKTNLWNLTLFFVNSSVFISTFKQEMEHIDYDVIEMKSTDNT
jgi:hypothetical protein